MISSARPEGWLEKARGPEPVRESFRRAFEKERLSHAYLLSGPNGSGKRTFALDLAKALFCDGGGGPCHHCLPCRRIEDHNHPSVELIEPRGRSLEIDQVRQISEGLTLRGRERRVYIFLHAERMTEPAANAFLKTLEEPLGETLLLLLTSNLGGILATIQSRCQKIPFAQPVAAQPLEGDLSDYLRSPRDLLEGSSAEQRERLRGFLARLLEANRAALDEALGWAAEPQALADADRLGWRVEALEVRELRGRERSQERLLRIAEDLEHNLQTDLALEAITQELPGPRLGKS